MRLGTRGAPEDAGDDFCGAAKRRGRSHSAGTTGMSRDTRVLLLAGSGEARVIAQHLAEMPGVSCVASMAGATRAPRDLAVPTRVGGFGGAEGFVQYLSDQGIDAVLDATHPFAARITDRTAQICASQGLPHAVLSRPEWRPGPGDAWRFVDHEHEVAALVPEGAVVFLGTGPQGLAHFANLPPRRVICRRIDPPRNPFPFAGGDYLVGRPPFSVADEIALFERLGVDVLVVKNAGGGNSRSKLDAARELGIEVVLIRRPPLPQAEILHSIDQALGWVRAQIGGAEMTEHAR